MTNHDLRDRIAEALGSLPWSEKISFNLHNEHDLNTVAGLMRKAFLAELAQAEAITAEHERWRVEIRRVCAVLGGPSNPVARKLLDIMSGVE